MATVTKTVRSSGGDYTSLSAYEAANQADLPDLDEIRQADCAGFNDTAIVTFDGWTTDATRYIRVFASDDHGGKYNTSTYRMEPAIGHFHNLQIKELHFRLDGVQLITTRDGSSGSRKTLSAASVGGGEEFKFARLILKAVLSDGATASAYHTDETISEAHFSNCLIYDYNLGASKGFSITGGAHWIYNCTIVNCLIGIDSSTTNTRVKNVGYDSQGLSSANGYNGSFHADSTDNASDLASDSPGSNAEDEVNPTYVDEGADDFHLASGDTAWKDKGADLSADGDLPITIDIDGETRSGSWDIGADEFVAAAVAYLPLDQAHKPQHQTVMAR